MITIIATLTFKPGKGADFAAGFPAAAERVLGSEPGTLLYKLVALRDKPDTYRVVEFYESQEAVDVHMANLRKSPSTLGDLLAERPLIELHDDV